MKRAKGKKLSKQIKKPTLKAKPVLKTSSLVDDGMPKSRVMSCVVTGLERRVSKAGVMKGNKKLAGL